MLYSLSSPRSRLHSSFYVSSRRRHTRCALVTGVQTCALPIYGRKEIADAVHAQLLEMDYGPHFQTGHPSSFELARRVAQLTPEGLDHVFFCCSGSESVDSAMKIALAYHRARGEGQRLRFISRERAYHGETGRAHV